MQHTIFIERARKGGMTRYACLLLRHTENYRRRAFQTALERLGFVVTDNVPKPKRHDVLVIWNRPPRHDRLARQFEAEGAPVIVCENGYTGSAGGKLIALARSHHSGAGQWPIGEGDRWSSFGIDLKPWRDTGNHLLVLPQRGYGEPGVGMPSSWLIDVVRRLRLVTRRSVVVRNHPSVYGPSDPDFTDAWAAVIWGSGAGIKALIAGVPVFYELEKWIGGAAARLGIDDIEHPEMGDRLPMLQRLAWAQWSPQEIETGEPIARLISS